MGSKTELLEFVKGRESRYRASVKLGQRQGIIFGMAVTRRWPPSQV